MRDLNLSDEDQEILDKFATKGKIIEIEDYDGASSAVKIAYPRLGKDKPINTFEGGVIEEGDDIRVQRFTVSDIWGEDDNSGLIIHPIVITSKSSDWGLVVKKDL